jgi:hypothetical protein
MDQLQQFQTKKLDKKLLILQVIYEYYKKHNASVLRRVRLKELSNDRLFEMTGGQQDDIGGSFQRHLRDLEDKGMLKQTSNKKRKQTTILFNIEKIEFLLLGNQLDAPDDKTVKRTEEDFDRAWEEMIEEVYSAGLEKAIKLRYNLELDSPDNDVANKSHSLLKEFTAKSIANMMSRTFEFNIIYPDGSLKLDRRFFKNLVHPLLKIVERDVRVPFRVEIDYKGFIRPLEKELTKFEPALQRIKAEYFEKWTREVFNYQISETDKRNAVEGRYDLLDNPASEYYTIFHNSTVYYTNLLNSLPALSSTDGLMK